MNAVNDINQQAAQWVVRLDISPRPPALEAEFEKWINADIRHRVAYLRHNSMWQKTQALARLRPLEGPIDADLLAPAPAPRSRWQSWRVAAAASVVLCVALLALSVSQLRAEKVYVTGIGNYQRIYLQDGSSIEMNTNSKVRVRFSEQSRRVELVRGEAKFQVAHAADRPFDVVSAGTVIRAVGTAFSVRIRDRRHVEVLVTEGRVVVVPTEAGEQTAAIIKGPGVAAGQGALIASDAVTVEPVAAPVAARRLAWTTGKLVFDNEPLAAAVTEFNRYNDVQLAVADRTVGAVRISGSFDVTNVSSFLAALERVFSIRAQADGDRAFVLKNPQESGERLPQ